ncbi:MAG: hypothetical protein ABIA93_04160 [Candidatus Woesearchaeota archaeon]
MKTTTLILLAVLFVGMAFAAPQGPTITYNSTETPTAAEAASITTAGGSFTTLLLNGSTQTGRWKAYVGNITGKFTLDDASGYSIYDWELATITGEVYASRNGSVSFSSVACSTPAEMVQEDTDLNPGTPREDSINRTFNQTVHRSFLVGTTNITASDCPSIATYVNGAPQAPTENADFQEVLITAGSSIVYTSLLEDDQSGYNNDQFDFQMIVAESELAGPSPYYFWVELG